ncbi:unnamed protein product [Microthlaspi erraticum]|uniref:Uncharacterized protein n=1 Tax=Microthlaspi erraticum TaxID=1685480 RepID=A0A6D2JYG3_9BRAS|nr:unnamed protein product [Microthlaspi erraticum]
MSISPSLSPRQCPDRYAFRAGRNLPDKEFRYLRTVIVTAAVHRGFGRRLPCHQSPGPGHCDPLCEEAPLLPKLRGYFAEFLRESCLAPLGILYLPTCVGFGYRYPFVEGRSSFSWEYTLVRIQCPENPRVPPQGSSTEGESGPKIRPKGVVDGQQCRKVKEVGDLMTGEPATEAPVNGGRNYNGPKVAKFLVG